MSSPTVSPKLQQIAETAVREPTRVFTTLAHLIDVDFLTEAYHRTHKDAAPGVDGVTADEYAGNLEENLQNLHERLRTGRYQAPPVKRVWLDKDDGRTQRPIGMPVFEDKIVQRAVAMILSAVYEQDFETFSFGFREGHSQHRALAELREKCREIGVAWIVDADVAGFFDTLDHRLLLKIIKKRVNDGALIRLIGKWLNAGVMEGTTVVHPETGTPQGGVISPVLSNIFLHYVLDRWYVRDVEPRIGRSFLIRFADDFLLGFAPEEDAKRVMAALPKRFTLFRLTIHPTKTTLIKFQRPSSTKKTDTENGSFDFLGFTHFWGRTREGYWVIKRKTAKKRLSRAMKSLWQWCRDHRHENLMEQYKTLSLKLLGHYQYYGIRSNFKMLEVVFEHVEKAWRRWLSRRSRESFISWDVFERLRKVFPLPKPRICHAI